MDTKLLGGWGETLAKNFLTKKKYSVIGMNYRTRFGEIDLIASDKKYVVFAEVKLRKSSMFAAAREFVDAKKQERIRKTAYIWLADNKTELHRLFPF